MKKDNTQNATTLSRGADKHTFNRVVEITKRYNPDFSESHLEELIKEGTIDYFHSAVGREPENGLEKKDAKLLNELYPSLREDIAKKAMGGESDSDVEVPLIQSNQSIHTFDKGGHVKVGDSVSFLQGRYSNVTQGRINREIDKDHWEITHRGGLEMIPKKDVINVIQKPKKLFGIFKHGGEAYEEKEAIEDKNREIEIILAKKGLNRSKYSEKDLKTISHFSYDYRISNELANKVWGLVKKSGFDGFKDANIAVLNSGNGELIRFIPDTVRRVDAIERDIDLFTISHVSFSSDKVHVFKQMDALRRKYDLAVGVCGGLKTIVHKDVVNSIKKGGLMVFVVSYELMETDSAEAQRARQILNEKFDFIEAFRLPSDVMSGFDLIALKRK